MFDLDGIFMVSWFGIFYHSIQSKLNDMPAYLSDWRYRPEILGVISYLWLYGLKLTWYMWYFLGSFFYWSTFTGNDIEKCFDSKYYLNKTLVKTRLNWPIWNNRPHYLPYQPFFEWPFFEWYICQCTHFDLFSVLNVHGAVLYVKDD